MTELAIARRSFRQVRTSALVCAVAFGGTAASSAVTYASSFPTAASRAQLAATTRGDAGLAVLFGPIARIDTVGGYTSYKTFVFLTTIAGIWALLAATRLLRGEEDAGRWQLVIAGRTRPPRATLAALAGLGAAVAVVSVGTTLLLWGAGRGPDVGFGLWSCVLYGASIGLVLAVFAAAGALASQLARTRRRANAMGAGFFAVAFLLRMIADSGPGTAWLRWLTPFGWSERIEPFTRDDPTPLVPALIVTLLLAGAAVVLAGRRDVGDGVLASSDVAPPRPFGLASPFGLALRQDLGVLSAWAIGAAATGFVLGITSMLTASAAKVPDSLGDTLEKFGVRGSFAQQYFGVAFLLVASVVALLPAGQVGAAADEELSGRLVHVAVRATSRRRWFGGRLALAAAGIAVAGTLAGAAAWAGARSQGVEVGFATMLGAGVNVVPTALVALGLGAVAVAFAPRTAGAAVYAVIIWSLLIDLVASMVSGLEWMGRTSLFHYMGLAPAEDLAPRTLLATTAVALALAVVAMARFERRDLHTG